MDTNAFKKVVELHEAYNELADSVPGLDQATDHLCGLGVTIMADKRDWLLIEIRVIRLHIRWRLKEWRRPYVNIYRPKKRQRNYEAFMQQTPDWSMTTPGPDTLEESE